jgi:hypothetical protein
VLVPVVLFAGGTVASQIYSPSRGQSLLPVLPAITEVSLPRGVGAQVYLQSSQAGVNQFHVIFTVPTGAGSPDLPRVLAERGTAVEPLRIVRYSSNHYIAYAVFAPGQWIFRIGVHLGGRLRSFDVERDLS